MAIVEKSENVSSKILSLQWEKMCGRVEAITALLRAADLKGPHLEIGTAAGKTLKAMMLAYREEARPPFVVVDTFNYFPGQLDHVRDNLRNAGIDPTTIDFRVGTS